MVLDATPAAESIVQEGSCPPENERANPLTQDSRSIFIPPLPKKRFVGVDDDFNCTGTTL